MPCLCWRNRSDLEPTDPQGTTPVSGLPEADAAALEERALKMRKAMGENLADDVAGESVDSKQRRLNLIRCSFSRLCYFSWTSCIVQHGWDLAAQNFQNAVLCYFSWISCTGHMGGIMLLRGFRTLCFLPRHSTLILKQLI